MEDYSVLGDDVEVYNLAPITVGSNSIISQNTYLCSATHDYQDPTFSLYSKPISIGSSAWIAADVFVGPGITIGDGAVVGARSVVTKDVPAWMVCAGNPCRPIKPRLIRKDTVAGHD
jgi:putative colanic acid biosynthesis acetyltransferase WcaF